MIKLSIIVPLYNSARYLPKCIESLEHQDIPKDEYELILVNDGSPDNSLELAEQYARQYSNIIVLSQENKGASGARNAGLKVASGVYLRFVDPDDYVPHNTFLRLLRQMEEERLDMLRFNYQVVDEQYNPIHKPRSAQHINYDSAIMDGARFLAERLGYACYIWTFIFRREIVANHDIAFYEGDYYDDTPWTPRVCLQAKRVNTTSFVGYYYYQSSNSLVRSKNLKAVQKKQNGYRFLIAELERQRKLVVATVAEKWYRGMIAHCVVSLLNSVTTTAYSQIGEVIRDLKRQKVFPLSTYGAENKTKRKIRLINFSPRLYCYMLYYGMKRSAK